MPNQSSHMLQRRALRVGPGRIASHDAASVSRGTGAVEALWLAMLAASDDCVKLLHPDGTLDFVSYGGLGALELGSPEQISGMPWWALWPEESRGIVKGAVQAARRGEVTKFTAFCPTAKGTPKWWDVSVAPVASDSDICGRILAVSRDVTDRERAEETARAKAEEAEVLRREVDHRVKNSLGTVVGLLRQDARASAPEVAGPLNRAAARVRSIAAVHDRIHRDAGAPSLNGYASDLTADLAAAMDAGGLVRFEGLAEDRALRPVQMQAVGLILAELVSNALIHGQLSAQDSLTVSLAEDAGGIVLTVADTGCGVPEAAPGGLGMRMMRMMAETLDGALDHEDRPGGGTVFTLRFPLS